MKKLLSSLLVLVLGGSIAMAHDFEQPFAQGEKNPYGA